MKVFHAAKHDLRVGIPLALAAVGGGVVSFVAPSVLRSRLQAIPSHPDDRPCRVAGFVLFYGVPAFRPARFPMLFLR